MNHYIESIRLKITAFKLSLLKLLFSINNSFIEKLSTKKSKILYEFINKSNEKIIKKLGKF